MGSLNLGTLDGPRSLCRMTPSRQSAPSARATPHNWPNWLWTLPRDRLKIRTIRTQVRCRLLGERAAYGAVARARKSCRKSGARRLHVKLPLRGGGRMTTEIAVLNRLGVALATDSAVTITSSGSSKVFNSADKLFELTCDFPVGVMVNGNMDCVGNPWELVIKDFREEEGKKSRTTIAGWANDLLVFAQRFMPPHQPDEDTIKKAAELECRYIRSEIFERFWGTRGLTTASAAKLIRSVSEERTQALLKRGLSINHEDIRIDEFISRHRDLLNDLIAQELAPVVPDDEAKSAVAVQIVTSTLSLASSPDTATGLIVAGYGVADNFPSISSVDLSGATFGRFRRSAVKEHGVVSHDKRGHVVSFAQNDVVERLLAGIDPRFLERNSEFVSDMFARFGREIAELGASKRRSKALKMEIENTIGEFCVTAKEEFLNASLQMQDDFRINFELMIAMMPKIELIEFAEALVNITAIERKATPDQGTVGGPIDVAFISKHEGFVWVKRKFYFNSALNPRYFKRKFDLSPKGERG